MSWEPALRSTPSRTSGSLPDTSNGASALPRSSGSLDIQSILNPLPPETVLDSRPLAGHPLPQALNQDTPEFSSTAPFTPPESITYVSPASEARRMSTTKSLQANYTSHIPPTLNATQSHYWHAAPTTEYRGFLPEIRPNISAPPSTQQLFPLSRAGDGGWIPFTEYVVTKEAGEKRKRNAEASARFRDRNKRKIQELREELHRTTCERDQYLKEIHRLHQLVQNYVALATSEWQEWQWQKWHQFVGDIASADKRGEI